MVFNSNLSILCALVALLAFVKSQDTADRPVVLCNRELFDSYCPEGRVTDNRGCPTEQCIEDPCYAADEICGPYEECYTRHVCDSYPCTQEHVEAVCIADVPCTGPTPMCGNWCDEYKYVQGCMTCDCVSPEEICETQPCPLGHQCIFDLSHEMWSAFREHAPDAKRLCIPDSFTTPAPTDNTARGLCDMALMALRREDEGQFERMAALHRVPLNNIFPIEDNCDENGGFLPRHCDADERTCFCVDDTGKKIPRSELRAFEGVCEPKVTSSSDVDMIFTHEMAEVDYESVKNSFRQFVSLNLEIDESLVEMRRVCSNGRQGELHVNIRLHLGSSDDVGSDPLPLTAMRLGLIFERDSSAFALDEDTQFVADLSRFHASHFQPDQQRVSDGSSSISSSSSESGSSEIFRAHPGLKGVAMAGGILIIIVVASITFYVCCRSRVAGKLQFNHQRMGQFKENLSNSTVMSSHPDVVIKDGSQSYVVAAVPEKKF